eukprot:28100-Pyramimonas_sp.AAC.1
MLSLGPRPCFAAAATELRRGRGDRGGARVVHGPCAGAEQAALPRFHPVWHLAGRLRLRGREGRGRLRLL